MQAHITAKEKEIAELLGEAWNKFLLLPKEHPMQDQEFCAAIHAAQDQVLMRVGRRSLLGMETSE